MALANLNTADFLKEGTNVTLSQTDRVITISSSGGGGGGTVTSVATTAPITGGTFTTSGTIGITQATTSTDGYLSSTDWNTFNNKQSTGLSWLLASGGTLTDVNTITSNAPNQLIFTGTWTATANNQYHFGIGGTITARATASDIAIGTSLFSTVIGATVSTNSQVLVGTLINPTFTNGGNTVVNNTALRIRPTFSALTGAGYPSYMDIIDPVSSTVALRFGKPQGDPTNATNNIYQFYGGSTNSTSCTLQIGSSAISWTANSAANMQFIGGTGSNNISFVVGGTGRNILQLNAVSGVASGQGVTVSQITVGNASNAGTQISSNFLSLQASLYNGVTNVIRRFHFQNVVSTSTNDLCNLIIGYNAAEIASYNQSGSHKIKGYLQTDSVISPAQITSNQNDYNPTGLTNAGILRLSSDASRDITGLVGGVSGRLLIITNVGSFDIVFKAEDAGSTAANRFGISADKTVASLQSITLWYDETSSRWRTINI